MVEHSQRSKRQYLRCKSMNKPAKNAKLATNKYVQFSGGKQNMKTIKPNVQMPSRRVKTSTPAQKGGMREDLGQC